MCFHFFSLTPLLQQILAMVFRYNFGWSHGKEKLESGKLGRSLRTQIRLFLLFHSANRLASYPQYITQNKQGVMVFLMKMNSSVSQRQKSRKLPSVGWCFKSKMQFKHALVKKQANKKYK